MAALRQASSAGDSEEFRRIVKGGQFTR